MPGIRETRVLPYSREQMFDLVADVGRYKEFLPWVVATRVRSDSETEMTADMVVGFKNLRESFTSRVSKQRPEMIDVQYVDGPLRDLDNRWHFEPLPNGGCKRWQGNISTGRSARWWPRSKPGRRNFTAAATPARRAWPEGAPRHGFCRRIISAPLPVRRCCCGLPARIRPCRPASCRCRHQARRRR